MINTVNSTMRLQAAARLMIDGQSLEYSAGLYCIPVRHFQDYLAGLFLAGESITPEIKKPSYHGEISDDVTIPKVVPPSDVNWEDIRPYYITIVDAKFHVIGNGLNVVDTKGWYCFKEAYEHAILCLTMDDWTHLD